MTPVFDDIGEYRLPLQIDVLVYEVVYYIFKLFYESININSLWILFCSCQGRQTLSAN
ncbi:hypothetical protein HALO59_50221 [Halomonas sp. 59]|nr:hypothetical protein HALO156_130863 [Halomonas sp. 156]CAD5265657.1 hypothetical protein HALOI3_190291 [Halomonas sp. I3]CAD5284152.1 hypothetical protein HALO113_80222 [Halomonas sp. 113]CAD5285625.1 hypothetical protein HALO59_50221 [Halomonas sp. 59]VXC33261.1 hypothetical protein HALO98_60126 [Halomonas titanicae]